MISQVTHPCEIWGNSDHHLFTSNLFVLISNHIKDSLPNLYFCTCQVKCLHSTVNDQSAALNHQYNLQILTKSLQVGLRNVDIDP